MPAPLEAELKQDSEERRRLEILANARRVTSVAEAKVASSVSAVEINCGAQPDRAEEEKQHNLMIAAPSQIVADRYSSHGLTLMVRTPVTVMI